MSVGNSSPLLNNKGFNCAKTFNNTTRPLKEIQNIVAITATSLKIVLMGLLRQWPPQLLRLHMLSQRRSRRRWVSLLEDLSYSLFMKRTI